MAKKQIMAVLSVEEEKLKEMEGCSIEKALGWCEDSGIELVSYTEIPTTLTLPRVGDLEKHLKEQYHLCVSNGMYIFDGDLEELFAKSGIKVETVEKKKDWNYNDEGEVVGANEGEIIEVVHLYQGENLFECNVYAQDCGCGLDYAIDLFNAKEVARPKVLYTPLNTYVIKSIEEEEEEEYFTLWVPSSVSKEMVMKTLGMARLYANIYFEEISEEDAENYDEHFKKMNEAQLGNGQEAFNYYLEECIGWEITPLNVDFWYEW